MFKASDDGIPNALESLGHRDLSQEGIDLFDRYVCQLYTSKVYTKVNDFRWLLCSNRTAEEDSLFPTTGSLTMLIQRAHYAALIWRKDVESHPSLPPKHMFWRENLDWFTGQIERTISEYITTSTKG